VSLIATVRARSNDDDQQPAPAYVSTHAFGPEIRMIAYAEAARTAEITSKLRTIAYGNAVRAHEQADALRAIDYARAIAENTPRPAPAVAAAAPRHAAPAPPPPAAPVSGDTSFTGAVFDAINARRAQAGLPPVAADARLAAAASGYAQTMLRLNRFGHDVDGTTFDQRIRAAGFTANVVMGEIIAMSSGPISAASIVQMWMDSPPHRSQIMSATFRLAGAGCAFAGGEVRCVVEFAG
jgi:uncharacterized protein YkwD